jgi:hypothetical protein
MRSSELYSPRGNASEKMKQTHPPSRSAEPDAPAVPSAELEPWTAGDD